MAVYTKVTAEEMNDFIAKYDVGKIALYQGIREGIENTNYLVKTDSEKYILTIFEKRSIPEELPFFMDLLDYLHDYGINCPTPVKDKRGNAIRYLCDKPACLSRFLYGSSTTSPNFANCRSLGKVMAKLHEATGGFPQTRENQLGIRHLRPLFDTFKDKLDDLIPNVRDEIEKALEKAETEWPDNDELPRGIIHGDLFPDNVFFTDNKISGIIDFFFACNDFYAYEMAIAINAWCFEKDFDFNVTKTRNLVAGYNSIRQLSKEELHYLPLFMLGSALRFFMTRAHDSFVNNDNALVVPKDPVEYLKKIRFHLHINNYHEYGI